MDPPKAWESRGHQNSLNFPSKYTSFGPFETIVGELNLILGFEKAVERIVVRVFEGQFKIPGDLLLKQ